MSPLQDRLKQFIALMDMSVLAFENKCGMAQGTVNKMTDNSRQRTLEKIHKTYPQLNMDWLKTGEGEMFNHATPMDIDIDLKMEGHSQMAFRDINNIGDAKTQLAVLQERIKALEIQLAEKNARIDELSSSLDRERKMNDFLMNQK